MHRFFVDSPLPPEVGAGLGLPAELAHQVGHVLRLRPGDRVVLLDNSGAECEVALTAFARDGVRGEVRAWRPAAAEIGPQITLYACLLKGEKFGWVLQKATELGVAAIVPVVSARTVVSGAEAGGKAERWTRIVREAAEQSRRGRCPAVAAPLPWPAAVARAVAESEQVLVPWEEAPPEAGLGPLLERARAAARVSVLVGPEGGLTAAEVGAATAAGALAVSLGPRILRAETASLALLALLGTPL
ncbi:MAG TPA: 16S rRNA (uracil(1498)-N(3))-methyltransferase [Chloroflexia bacterium]|nr:16S rRNA (uracil(1498)-N(3))-methyltransferase [Chloroflexia bacterium]